MNSTIIDTITPNNNMPIWILFLTIFCRLCGSLKEGTFKFFMQLISLFIIFGLEICYFWILERDFYWCEGLFTGRWFKSILFTLFSLGVLYLQFKSYFSVLTAIKERSCYFNSHWGTIILTVLIFIFFLIALFTGGNPFPDFMVYIVIFTIIAIQEIMIIIKLNRYPLYMIIAMIYLPFGIFALLITSLNFFSILLPIMLIGLVVYAMAQNKSVQSINLNAETENSAKPHHCPYYNSQWSRCHWHDYDGQGGETCNVALGGSCPHGRG